LNIFPVFKNPESSSSGSDDYHICSDVDDPVKNCCYSDEAAAHKKAKEKAKEMSSNTKEKREHRRDNAKKQHDEPLKGVKNLFIRISIKRGSVFQILNN